MGDPRKQRKKYERPPHPWQGARIEQEKEWIEKYGLAKKKEIWKMSSLLRQFKRQAKSLIIRTDAQAKKEEEQLLNKLCKLGLLEQGAKLENILDLNTTDILDRRLQTLLHAKGLARTLLQARQFIVHQHVTVAGKKITVPSYLVKRLEEDKLSFTPNSSLSDQDHPERAVAVKEKPEPKKEQPEEVAVGAQ